MIIKTDQLDKILLNIKNNKVGTINGTFDLLHKGHKDGINQARNILEHLFILVNDDLSVKRYKGPTRPIETLEKRMKKLNTEFPDCYILNFSELTPIKILLKINPNVHFISEDWGKSPIEKYFLKGTKFYLIKKNYDISTTKIIRAKNKENYNTAVFLDRDGTITKDNKYKNTIKNFSFLENSLDGLMALSKKNFKLIVITNQSAVSRGIIQKKDVAAFNRQLVNYTKKYGVNIDHIYTSYSEKDSSPFRKPNNKFFELAADKFELSLSKSWFIGDKETDMIAGKLSNTKTIFVGKKNRPDSEIVDYFSNDLLSASKIILSNIA